MLERTLTPPAASRAPEASRAPRSSGKADLSARIVSTAARWVYEGKRLDMQGLADELGVSRVTLFRRIGGREELISQALWRLAERMLDIAVERWEAERPEGELHTPGTIRHINAMVAGSTGLRRLLDDEPALTMRVLTDPRGRVQTGIVAADPREPLRPRPSAWPAPPAPWPRALPRPAWRPGSATGRAAAGC